MERIGPGTLLAGRYRLQEQVQADEVTSLWLAHDTTLEKSVGVRVIEATHAKVQATLDAARRAALIDERRLQRILGVGTEAGSGFVVLEWVSGDDAGDLAGSVPEQEAVRIVTEATEALRTAAARSLHHGRLGPRQLVRTPDGAVRVVGTAIDVAASGQPTPAAAARPEARDVRDLSAVLYALATGSWPFGAVEDLPAAPTERGRPVPATQLRADISRPLELLLAETLSGQGPDSLDALAERLHEVRTALAESEAAAAAAAAAPVAPGAPVEDRDVDQERAERAQEQTPGPAGDDAPRPTDDAHDDVDTDVITPVQTPPGRPGASVAAGAGAAGAVAGSAAAGSAVSDPVPPATGAAPGPAPAPRPPAPTTDAPAPVEPAPSTQASQPAQAPQAPEPPQPTWVEDDGWDLLPVGGQQWDQYGDQQPWDGVDDQQGWEKQPWDDDAAWDDPGGPGPPPVVDPRTGRPQDPRASTVVPVAKAPRQARPSGRRPAGAGTGVAVILVMGAVVLGTLVWAVDRFREEPVAAPAPAVSESAVPSPAPSAPPSVAPEPSPEPSVGVPELVLPAGVQALDPQGDGEENDQEAPRAIDGDPGTSWESQAYNSQDFGGLKTGLGLALDLGEPREVSAVVISAPGSDGEFEVRTADRPSFDGSTVIADGATGDSTELQPETPVTTQFLVIWFTSLPENDGDWRAVVDEVEVAVQ